MRGTSGAAGPVSGFRLPMSHRLSQANSHIPIPTPLPLLPPCQTQSLLTISVGLLLLLCQWGEPPSPCWLILLVLSTSNLTISSSRIAHVICSILLTVYLSAASGRAFCVVSSCSPYSVAALTGSPNHSSKPPSVSACPLNSSLAFSTRSFFLSIPTIFSATMTQGALRFSSFAHSK